MNQLTKIDDLYKVVDELNDKGLLPAAMRDPNKAVTAISYAYQLGFKDPISGVQAFDIISGTIALKAKIIPGLLAKNGVAIEVIKDYDPIYEEKPVPITDDVNGKKVIRLDANNVVQYYKNEDGSLMMKKDLIDYITEVKFTRVFPDIGPVVNTIKFRWSEAIKAGWDTKDNWKKMPAYMMLARAISKGARVAASDIMHGLYDSYEVADMNNVDVTIE